METQNKTQKNLGIFLSVIIVFAVVLITTISDKKSSTIASLTDASTSSPGPAAAVVPPVTPVIDTKKQSASVYNDGTYSATGSYMSPGGQDQIAVTVTLASDIITDVSVTTEPGDRTSAKYQSRFASGYKAYVVGKNIADVNLTAVSGSSLTPIGFDQALTEIKSQAQA